MSTITLDINSNIQDFISFYEKSRDFDQFFEGVLHFYNGNKEKILKKRILEVKEFHEIVEALSIFLTCAQTEEQNEQRERGRYFTPKSVCRFINQRVLDNYEITGNSDEKFPLVLDPSSGLGYFIIDMFFLLIKLHLKRKSNVIDLEKIISNIYGFEIDEKTIVLCQNLISSIFGLILFIRNSPSEYPKIRKMVRKNIVHQDFLKEQTSITPNIIIGNPPYVRVHKMDPQDNSYLRKHYFTAKNDFDVYVCFFEKSLKILPKEGILGFITPEKYLLRKYARNLRLLLLINSVILEFIDVSRCRDIFKVFAYPIITILKKSIDGLEISKKDSIDYQKRVQLTNPSNTIHFIRTPSFNPEVQIQIHSIFGSNPSLSMKNIEYRQFENADYDKLFNVTDYRFSFILDPIIDELEEIFKNCSRIDDTESTIFCGTPRSKFYHRVRENLYQGKKDQETSLKFIISKNIAPYFIFWNLPIIFDKIRYNFPQYKMKDGIFSSKKVLNFKKIPKLVIKATSRNITAALDKVGHIFIGAYGLVWECENYMPIDVLCAILNSNLINYYIARKFKSYMVNSQYLSVNSIILKDIPLPGKIGENNREFHPIIPETTYKKITSEISQKISEIEMIVQNIQSTQELEKIKKLKGTLMGAQLYSRGNQDTTNPEIKLVNQLTNQLNHLIYELYAIPKPLRLR